MCYGAYTKGHTALIAGVLGTAENSGVREALMRRWAADGSGLDKSAAGRVARITDRAWRWVGEMDEIASTFEHASMPRGFHDAAGDIYRRLAQFKDQAPPSTDTLDRSAQEAGAARVVTSRPLTLEPIGYVRTALQFKDEAPRQPRASGGAPGRIELLSGRNYEHALLDIEGWDHIWVLFWFHHNAGWRPKVLPPRSTSGRKGVFATRSPHRPNPIGLSAVRLERIEGLTLHVQDIDMLDGTPVLDLKPYVAYTDAIVDARNGWLDGADPIAAFDVQWDAAAAEQAAWVEARTSLTLRARVTSTLALGPEPQPYRRIRRDGEVFVLAVKDWRARFSVEGRRVRVHEIRSGYRDSQLSGANRCDADLSAHREFTGMQSQSTVAESARRRRGNT